MKKLLTLALVGAMLTATGITAFAETTNVSYNVDPSYTVSIPAAIPLSDSAVEADIEASDVILEDGKQIKVELTSASNTASGSTFNAKNGDSAVTYTITGDEAIAVGDTVATFTANGSKTLTFSAADKSGATVAGAHTETLTFTIAVEDSVESALAPALENGATMVVAYKWNEYNTTTFTFTNNNGTYSCNVGGSSASDFSGSLTLNGTTLALSITNSFESDINLAINFDTTNDTYSFVTKDNSGWYTSHTVSVNGTDITSQLTQN